MLTVPKRPLGHDSTEPGKKIRLLRDTLRLTRRDVADMMGVEQVTVQSYEYRENASPSADKVRRLVDALVVRYGTDRERLLAWMYDGAPTYPDLSTRTTRSVPLYVGGPGERGEVACVRQGETSDAIVTLHAQDYVAVQASGIPRVGYGATVYVTPGPVSPGVLAYVMIDGVIYLGRSVVKMASIRLESYMTGADLGPCTGYAMALMRPSSFGKYEVEYLSGAPLPA